MGLPWHPPTPRPTRAVAVSPFSLLAGSGGRPDCWVVLFSFRLGREEEGRVGGDAVAFKGFFLGGDDPVGRREDFASVVVSSYHNRDLHLSGAKSGPDFLKPGNPFEAANCLGELIITILHDRIHPKWFIWAVFTPNSSPQVSGWRHIF